MVSLKTWAVKPFGRVRHSVPTALGWMLPQGIHVILLAQPSLKGMMTNAPMGAMLPLVLEMVTKISQPIVPRSKTAEILKNLLRKAAQDIAVLHAKVSLRSTPRAMDLCCSMLKIVPLKSWLSRSII